jgi:ferritin-like metal-binding protein YciE
MKNKDLHALFIDELANVLDAENQIIQAFPKLIKSASSADLKEALTTHLQETENQVIRLEQIFEILGEDIEEKECAGMEGILSECDDMINGKSKSPILDAAIMSAARKVEHYEMASYGTLSSFANHLDLDSEIIELLHENLDEEGAADKKLTKIADGTLFSGGGLNKETAEKTTTKKKSKK